MPEIAHLTHEYFEPLTGRIFKVEIDNQTVDLKLQEVMMLPPARRRSLSGRLIDVATKRQPFSILFRSEGTTHFKQGTYSLQPPEGDPLLIFLVPLGVEHGGVIYEAIFT